MNTTFNAEEKLADEQGETAGFVDAQEELSTSVLSDRKLSDDLPSTPCQPANSSMISGSATISRGTRPVMPVEISPIVASSDDSPRNANRQRQKTMVVESGLVSDFRKYLSGLQNRDEEVERKMLSALAKCETESNRSMTQISRLTYKLFTCKEIMKLYGNNQADIQDLPIGGMSLSNSTCLGDCEISKKNKLDLDTMKKEHDDLYREYALLFENYGKVKQSAHTQRGELEQYEQRVLADREEHNNLKAKFLRLKENASDQLAQASQDMDEVERKHANDTQGLRMKVRTLEMQLRNTQNEVELKRKEVDELREMVRIVLNEVEPGSDVESDRGI